MNDSKASTEEIECELAALREMLVCDYNLYGSKVTNPLRYHDTLRPIIAYLILAKIELDRERRGGER